ncbi:hypothetical protein ACFLXW_00195 [Candidatus Dependentiae bacterium]
MKKHLTILFCAVVLGISYCSVNTLSREDQLKKEGILQQTIENELADLREKEAVTQRRIAQLKQPSVRGIRSEQELQKLIARERRTLSQLKRTRARLLLKQASELAN